MKKHMLTSVLIGTLCCIQSLSLFAQRLWEWQQPGSARTDTRVFNETDSILSGSYQVLLSGDTVKVIGSGSAIKHVYGYNFTQHQTYNLTVSFIFRAHDPVVQGSSLKYALQIVSGTVHHWGEATDYFLGSTTVLNFDYTHNYGSLTNQGTLYLAYPGNIISSLSFALPYNPYANHFDPYYLQFFSPNTVQVNIANFDIWEFDEAYQVNGTAEGLVRNRNLYFLNHYGLFNKVVSRTPSGGGSMTAAKICADASDSITRIIFSGVPSGINISSIIFRMENDPNGINSKEYGSFGAKHVINSDSMYVEYCHPRVVNSNTLFKSTNLQIFLNSGSGLTLLTYPLNIYRAPVTLVHGLWGDAGAFKLMGNYLVKTKMLWPDLLVVKADYRAKNSFHFADNVSTVTTAINSAIIQAIIHDFSAGKSDVVGHSMGGILTRLWIQNPKFTNNINRFITLNTPHAGAQSANLLIENQVIARQLEAQKHFTQNGGVDDLRVNSNAILDLNKVGNRNSVATALFVTHQDPDVVGWLPDPAAKWLVNLVQRTFPSNPNVFSDIFNDTLHDIIVPDSSQAGGLAATPYVTTHEDIWHAYSPNHGWILESVYNLLLQDPADVTKFTKNPITPPTLTYVFDGEASLNSRTPLNPSQNSIAITSPPSGTVVNPGSIISINVTGTQGISSILFSAGGVEMDFDSQCIESPNATFTYSVPQNSSYSIPVSVAGFDENGFADMDTIVLLTQITDPVDSMAASNAHIYVGRGELVTVSVFGYFPGGVTRNLSSHPEVNYQINNHSVAAFISPGILKGMNVDTTSVLISFRGVTICVPVTVLDPIFCIYSSPPLRNLQNISVNQGDIVRYDASRIVSIAGDNTFFLIQNGGIAQISAGKKISMLPGFKVLGGAKLTAFIPTDGGYCDSKNVIGNLEVGSGQTHCYEAANTLTIAGNGSTFSVSNNGSVTFVAGMKITMLPGTAIHAGGHLNAYITTNGSFCNFSSFTDDPAENTQRSLSLTKRDPAQFEIYPNPTAGSFTIRLRDPGLPGSFMAEIFSMQGERILSKEFSSVSIAEFDLSGNPAGLYFIRIIKGKKVESLKIIKF